MTEERINERLEYLIPSDLKGGKYLRLAVKLYQKDKRKMNDIYKKIAEQMKKSDGTVKSEIDRTIGIAYDRDPEKFYKFFGKEYVKCPTIKSILERLIN